MKTLIAYASKSGTTKKAAKSLKDAIENAYLCDLNEEDINPSEYDCIIVGGSIRAGMLHKLAKSYIKKYHDVLKTKKIAFFVCSAEKENYQDYFTNNIDAELLNNALTYDTFGGELHLDKEKGLSKMIVKVMLKKPEFAALKLDEARIKQFAKSIK